MATPDRAVPERPRVWCYFTTLASSSGHCLGDPVSQLSPQAQPCIPRIHGVDGRRGIALLRLGVVGRHNPDLAKANGRRGAFSYLGLPYEAAQPN